MKKLIEDILKYNEEDRVSWKDLFSSPLIMTVSVFEVTDKPAPPPPSFWTAYLSKFCCNTYGKSLETEDNTKEEEKSLQLFQINHPPPKK